MTRKSFAVSALLIAFTLVLVPACGGEEEPTKPDQPDKPAVNVPDQPDQPDAPDPNVKAPEEPKTWGLNAKSLEGYITAVTDLKENAPKALGRDRNGGKVLEAKVEEGHAYLADEQAGTKRPRPRPR